MSVLFVCRCKGESRDLRSIWKHLPHPERLPQDHVEPAAPSPHLFLHFFFSNSYGSGIYMRTSTSGLLEGLLHRDVILFFFFHFPPVFQIFWKTFFISFFFPIFRSHMMVWQQIQLHLFTTVFRAQFFLACYFALIVHKTVRKCTKLPIRRKTVDSDCLLFYFKQF